MEGAAGGKVVSQYNLEYCGRRQGCLCRKTGSCVAIQQGLGSRSARGGAWRAAGHAGRVGGRRRALSSGRAGPGCAGGAQARGTGGSGARGGRGRGGARAHGARGMGAGRAAERAAGLARAMHLVHSACFWPGLTQYCS